MGGWGRGFGRVEYRDRGNVKEEDKSEMFMLSNKKIKKINFFFLIEKKLKPSTILFRERIYHS